MSEPKTNKFDLEDRLVNFSVLIIEIVSEMPSTCASKHLSKQLVRSGTSVALNYGEAQAGESRRDFIHKMKIALKECRETFICLKIVNASRNFKTESKINAAMIENNELIAIFIKSIATAKRNMELIG